MIDIQKAAEIILSKVPRMEPVELPLQSAIGLILAEDIHSDVDLPPFDKSAMDGYAVRSEDLTSGDTVLDVVEELAAGQTPTRRIEPGMCAKIMTGAPVPREADAVVMVEKTEPAGDGKVRILKAAIREENICIMGEDLERGDIGVSAGSLIRAQEAAILASIGGAHVRVYPPPEATIISTGDELVPFADKPGPGKIRDSNSVSVAARLARLGVKVKSHGIVRDDLAELRESIENGLSSDLLIVSGGVSMGDFDLVPAAMREAGIELFFEKVAVKPGKPTVFGRRDGTTVFGLPGNPVSSLVIAELLVVPAVREMIGAAEPLPTRTKAMLTEPMKHKGDRDSFVPVRMVFADGWFVEPVEYHGSADIIGFARGNALAMLPKGVKRIEDGEKLEVITLWSDLT